MFLALLWIKLGNIHHRSISTRCGVRPALVNCSHILLKSSLQTKYKKQERWYGAGRVEVICVGSVPVRARRSVVVRQGAEGREGCCAGEHALGGCL